MMKLIQVLLLIFVVSCSSIQPIQRSSVNKNVNNQNTSNSSVNSKQSEVVTKSIEEKIDLKKNEETVRIGEKGGEVYLEDNNQLADFSNRRNLKVSLTLGPGLMRTFGYISILKNLEKNNLKPTVVTGSELGSVVAGLYAAGTTPEMIEWMFFKYFRDKKNYRPYEADWVNEIDEYFLQKIKNVKIEDAKIKFFVTLYDHGQKKAYFFDKGNIRDLVMLNLRLFNRPAKFKTGQIYTGAMEKEVYNSRLMTSLGGEFNIAVDSLNSKIEFENKNEFITGVLGKVSAIGNAEKKQFDYVINLPLQRMKLDSNKDGNNFLQVTNDFMNSQMANIKKRIQLKMDIINNPSNKE